MKAMRQVAGANEGLGLERSGGRRRPWFSTIAGLAALTLTLGMVAACNSDVDDSVDGVSESPTTVAAATTERDSSISETSTTEPSTTQTTTSNGSGGESASEVPAPPADGSKACVDLEERDDGRYDLGEAGTVVISRDGAKLKLDDVEKGDGWTVDVDDDDDDEVELDLRSDDGTKVEFEAEIENGDRLEIEVCTRRK